MVLFVVLAVLLPSGYASGSAQYYRKVRVDGNYKIVGTYPVSPEMAEKTKCYHFFHDERGRLTCIEFLKNGTCTNDHEFCVAKIIFNFSQGEYETRIFHNAPSVYAIYNPLLYFSNAERKL